MTTLPIWQSVRNLVGVPILLLLIWPGPCAGQGREDSPWRIWLERANHITAEIAEQSKQLDRSDRIRLLGRVGVEWRPVDQEQAKHWFTRAIRELDLWDPKETGEKLARLRATHWLLSEFTGLEPDLLRQLTTMLLKYSEDAKPLPRGEEERNASAIARAAESLARSDSEEAYRFGRAALDYGGSPAVADLVGRLNEAQPELAGRLFSEALSRAEQRRDLVLLGSLAYWAAIAPRAFPELRARAVTMMREAITTLLPGEKDFALKCRFVTSAGWLGEEIPSEQRALLESIVTSCREKPGTRLFTLAGTSPQAGAPRTADEYIRAAESSPYAEEKAMYLLRAALKLSEAGDLEAAIRTLDRVPPEARENQWHQFRYQFTSRAAYTLFQANDVAGMYRVIRETPQNIRISVQLEVTEKLAKSGNHNTALQLAFDARSLLERQKQPDPIAYMVLANCFALISHEWVPPTLKKAVDIWSATREGKPSPNPLEVADPRDFHPYAVSSVFLEVEPALLPDSRRIRNPYIRFGLLVGMLRTALEQAKNRPCCPVEYR